MITRHEYEDWIDYRKQFKYNSKLFLPSMSKEFRKHVYKYNNIVKDVYGCYIKTVSHYLRSMNNEQEEILPFTNISFVRNNDYDNGTFEYNLHHHHSQQKHNPSISPFAGVSGLTHEQFILNYNSIISSWDLAYNLNLSSKVIPFIDVDCRDHSNTAYHLNSYGLDFFKHGSESSLITENKISPGDTYSLLLDLHLVLSSVKTSLEVIIRNDEHDANNQDLKIFHPLYQSLSEVQNTFSNNFHRQYPSRQKI